MDKRVKFDFEVDFSNGGGIQGQDFRLDIHSDDIADSELADTIVNDMRLLMVGAVRILNKSIITEPHKRHTLEDPFSRGRQAINLSHVIEDGLVTYKGLPAPVICDFLSREASKDHYADGTTFHIGKIEMVANTGTYIDSPFHRYADGIDIADLPLASTADLDGVVIRMTERGSRAIDTAAFESVDVRGKAVLVHTGWDARWNTDAYFEGHPFLTADAAAYLVESGATLVGIDSLNIDDIAALDRPVHTTLLGANIPIVEHMCKLELLPDTGFRFFAVPAKVRGMGTFPVQAFALVG